MKISRLLCIKAAVLVLAGIWVYWPAMHGTWLWDDDIYITQNTLLRSPLGLERIWLAPPGVNYFPLTATVQWLQWQLWGLNTLGYHWSNLSLHLLSAFLFWRLLWRIGLKGAWIGGLFLVLHPMAVESVAWISELKNTLSLPLLLLAALAYIEFDSNEAGINKNARRRSYLLAIFLFLLAMLCKSTVAMFPVILLLYDWWKRGHLKRSDFKRSIPFFGISVGLGTVTVWFEHHRAMIVAAGTLSTDLPSRLESAGMAIVFYFSKCTFPLGLMPIYPRWEVGPPSLRSFLPVLALCSALGYLWRKRTDWGRQVLFGLGFFLVNLTPVIGLISMSYLSISRVADHFVYLPLLGLFGLASAFRSSRPGWLWVITVAAVFAWESRCYTAKFSSPDALWTYALDHNSEAWLAHNDLGNLLLGRGRIEEAIAHFERALRLNPNFADAHNDLAAALVRANRLTEAIHHYQQALRLRPDLAAIHYNLGIALVKAGRQEEAIAQYEAALRLNPAFPEADNDLGNALADAGRSPEAIARYQAALRLRPSFAEAHANLGSGFAHLGRWSEAVVEYRLVLQLEPTLPGLHAKLGNALAEAGRPAEAIRYYREQLRLTPEDADVHFNLGLALQAQGLTLAAESEFARAAKIKRPALR